MAVKRKPKQPHTPEEQVAWAMDILRRAQQELEGVASVLRAAAGAMHAAITDSRPIAKRALTAEERERDLYGDFDAAVDALLDITGMPAEAIVMIARRFADKKSLQARCARGEASPRPSRQHGIGDPHKAYLPGMRGGSSDST